VYEYSLATVWIQFHLKSSDLLGCDPVSFVERVPAILGHFLPQLIAVDTRSKVWVCGRSFAKIAGSNPTESMESVVCYQVEVSAMDRSLVQGNPTGCGESERDREPSRRSPGILGAVALLLPAGVTNTRCCRHSCMRS
jgi:hypothetical protein